MTEKNPDAPPTPGREQTYATWFEWALPQVSGSREAAKQVATAAVEAIEEGASPDRVTQVARQAVLNYSPAMVPKARSGGLLTSKLVRYLGVFGVLFAIGVGADIWYQATTGCGSPPVDTANHIIDVNNNAVTQSNKIADAFGTCTDLPCAQIAAARGSDVYTTFNAELAKVCWPNKSKANINRLIASNSKLASDFRLMSTAVDYSKVKALPLVADLAENDAASQAVANDLGTSYGAPTPSP